MNTEIPPLLTTNIPQLKLCNRGKVRDIYEINDSLLIVATDRISAFDVVLPNGIPYKGKVLTGLSEFWFQYTSGIIENHLITTRIEHMNNSIITQHKDILEGRSMLVKKVEVIPVECVIRGYLAGSGWKEYQNTQSICGIKLPPGLKESEKLPEPIFTPSTKATTGHDENIPFSEVVDSIGKKLAEELRKIENISEIQVIKLIDLMPKTEIEVKTVLQQDKNSKISNREKEILDILAKE